jgi:EAL domain-containing protein (putative c-di-GMP-specific phosphodiesterase class I)
VFIALAEQVGLIIELSKSLLRQAQQARSVVRMALP